MKKLLFLLPLLLFTACSVDQQMANVDKAIHDPVPYTLRTAQFRDMPIHDLYEEYGEKNEPDYEMVYCYRVNKDNYQTEVCY